MLKVRLDKQKFDIALARNNLSQNSLARLIGVSTGYLSQVVLNKRYPSGQTRQKIQNALGLTFDDLFIIEGK